MNTPRIPLILLLLVISATAGERPGWAKGLDSMKPGPHPPIRRLAADYRVSWKGMVDAGTVSFEFGQTPSPGVFSVRAHGGSEGMASRLFRYRFDFTGRHDPRTGRPIAFTAVETDKKDTTTFTLGFGSGKVTSHEDIRPHGIKKVFTRDYRFDFAPVHDVFSGMLHVRGQPLKTGDRLRFVIYPMSSAYLVDVTVTGREVLHSHPAIRMDVAMQRIGDDLRLEAYDKLTKATLWLADDRDRLPLELRAKVFIGDVRLSLKGARSL